MQIYFDKKKVEASIKIVHKPAYTEIQVIGASGEHLGNLSVRIPSSEFLLGEGEFFMRPIGEFEAFTRQLLRDPVFDGYKFTKTERYAHLGEHLADIWTIALVVDIEKHQEPLFEESDLERVQQYSVEPLFNEVEAAPQIKVEAINTLPVVTGQELGRMISDIKSIDVKDAPVLLVVDSMAAFAAEEEAAFANKKVPPVVEDTDQDHDPPINTERKRRVRVEREDEKPDADDEDENPAIYFD